MNYKKVFQLSLIKTLHFNLHYFGFKGLKLPVLVSRYTRLSRLEGEVYIEKPSFGCIHIGFEGVSIFDAKKDRAIWDNSGKIVFKSKATLGQGTRLSNAGIIEFGHGFRMTANSYIICYEAISFGDNVLISWECSFMDTDMHKITKEKENFINLNKAIVLGNNIWVGCKTSVLKGTRICDNTVIAARSLLCGENVGESNQIITSHGKILKRNIDWYP